MSNSFVHGLDWDKEAEDLIDAATCPPLARIVSDMTIADSKLRNIATTSRRLKIFEKITTKEEENLLESEKHNDNRNNCVSSSQPAEINSVSY